MVTVVSNYCQLSQTQLSQTFAEIYCDRGITAVFKKNSVIRR